MNKLLISLFLTIILLLRRGIVAFNGNPHPADSKVSTAEGAIVDGVAGFTNGNPAAMGFASAAANAVKQGINEGFDKIDKNEVVISGIMGYVGAGGFPDYTKCLKELFKLVMTDR